MSVTSRMIDIPCVADVHVHLRQGEKLMSELMRYSAEGGADVLGAMPNTKPELTTAQMVVDYHSQIERLKPARSVSEITTIKFLMLSELTTPEELEACAAAGVRNAKLYPKGRTTNSENGIRHYEPLLPLIKKCGELGIMVHVHPEHPCLDIIGRDAEYQFISVIDMFLHQTTAKIVWEHGTDARCIRFWKKWAKEFPNRFFVTLTAHHLCYDDDMDHGDVAATCKPPIKTKDDCVALVNLVGEDHSWVMAGSDTAYHPIEAKNVDSGGCACGDFTAPFLAPLYAHALDGIIARPGGIGVFENFISTYARRVHDLPRHSRRLRLVREPWTVPLAYDVGGEIALPFMRGKEIMWRFA